MYLETSGKLTRLSEFPEVKPPHFSMYFILDWVSQVPVPWVDDLKTGRFLPDSDTQLRAYSWALQEDLGSGNLASWTHWPRYPKGQPPRRPPATYFTYDEIHDWYSAKVIPARRLAQRPDASEDTRPGPHCDWCPSKPHCKEWDDTRDNPNHGGDPAAARGDLYLRDSQGQGPASASPARSA